MHPRNPYSSPPDFQKLAEAYPSLQPHLVKLKNGDVTIDFQDGSAQRCLTEALLYRDFNLVVTIPEDRLCPTVPNRLNYILWLEDLLTSTGPLQTSSSNDPITSRQMKCRGIDIGLGASAIYPLLACRISPNWTMVGTDIDPMSLQSAKINIAKNDLTSRISVSKAQATVGATIFPSQLRDFRESVFDFTMCNPPFYSSKQDVSRSAEGKSMGPNAVCTGADVEMITPGGEAELVRRMVQESLLLRERCRWYTSMLGKLSSLAEIVEALRENKVDNYAITEFVQGQTRRWAIAWSFGELRAPDTISRISNPTVQNLMPSRTTLYQSLYPPAPSSESVIVSSSTNLRDTLQGVIRSVPGLDVKAGSFVSSSDSHPPTDPVPSTSPPETVHSSTPSSPELIPPPNIATLSSASTSSDGYFLISAPRNTWSRAARRAAGNSRKRKRDAAEDTEGDIGSRVGGSATNEQRRASGSPDYSPESPILVCRVFMVDEPAASRTTLSSSKSTTATASGQSVEGSSERVTETEQSTKIGFEWVRGKDRAVFEGFVNHVGRKMRDAVAGRDLKAGG